jgi:hypothetical protein
MSSAGPSLLEFRFSSLAESFKMKQSSPLIFLSAMHLAFVNMAAVVNGSRPWSKGIYLKFFVAFLRIKGTVQFHIIFSEAMLQLVGTS